MTRAIAVIAIGAACTVQQQPPTPVATEVLVVRPTGNVPATASVVRPSPFAEATQEPTPTPLAEPTATEAPTASPLPTMSPTPVPTPAVGQVRRVRVANTDGQGANLRAEPSARSPRLTVVRDGVELEVIGPDERAEANLWRNVRDDTGESGWMLGDFLVDTSPSAPRPSGPLTILVTENNSPVRRGADGKLTIVTRPGAYCEVRIAVYGPPTIKVEGLAPVQADNRGECAWTWRVPAAIVPGTWRYIVTVGAGETSASREVPLVVT